MKKKTTQKFVTSDHIIKEASIDSLTEEVKKLQERIQMLEMNPQFQGWKHRHDRENQARNMKWNLDGALQELQNFPEEQDRIVSVLGFELSRASTPLNREDSFALAQRLFNKIRELAND